MLTVIATIAFFTTGLCLVEYIAPKPPSKENDEEIIELSQTGMLHIVFLLIVIIFGFNLLMVCCTIFVGPLVGAYSLFFVTVAFLAGGVIGISKLKYELKHSIDIPIIPKTKSYI